MPARTAAAAAILAALVVAAPAHAQVDWAGDLQEVRRALQHEHPGFFARQEREAFETAYEALARDIGGLSDRDVIVRLAELVAMGRDGHTRLTLPLEPQAGLFGTHRATETSSVTPFGQFPLRLRRAQDGYVVTRAAPEFSHLLGAQLLSIDGVATATVEERILPVIHGDNLHQRQNLARSFMVVPEILAARGVVRDAQRSLWRFRLRSGRVSAVRLEWRNSSEEIAWRLIDGETHDEAPQSLRRTDDGVLVVRIAEVAEAAPGGFSRFVDEFERTMAQEAPRAVLVDLRGNFGGDNSLIDPFVRALGRDRSLWAPGRLFVAIDGGTFSAAMQLTTALERWTPAIFIGSPTAAAPNHYGDAQRIVLPASGLTLRVSSLYWQSGDPRDSRDAVTPLIDAAPRISYIQSSSDPVLRFVQASTRQGPNPVRGRWRGRIALEQRLLSVELSVDQALTVAVPEARLPAASLRDLRIDGGGLDATGEVAGYPARVRAQVSEAGMLGQIELRGRFYPFAAERQGD